MLKRAESYASIVSSILDEYVAEVSKLISKSNYDGSEWFMLDSFPDLKRKIEKLQKRSVRNIKASIVNGVTASWDSSNFKNDLVAQYILGENSKKEAFQRYFNNHGDALNSFINRRRKGLNLSARIWKMEEEFQTNLEAAISCGFNDGRSAEQLSRDIREYLREPHKLFRRIREFDEDGKFRKWRLSKAAKGYCPGAGVYRSSYKNAMRLARTEINMAYRQADMLRWADMDFIVGYEVKRSMSKHFDCDLCQSLAGKYPKDFVFTGWHPQCMCYAIPIFKTQEEIEADDKRIMNGEEPSTGSVNTIDRLPDGFNEWLSSHTDYIQRAKKNGLLPYFLRDNSEWLDVA